MNSRERVALAMNHKEADRVPLDFGAGKSCKFSMSFYKKLLDYFGINEEIVCCNMWGQLAWASDAVLDKLKTDVRAPLPITIAQGDIQGEEYFDDKYRYYRSEFGFLLRMPRIDGTAFEMVSHPLSDSESMEEDAAYKWPTPPLIDPISRQQAQKYHDDGYPTVLSELYGNGFLQLGSAVFDYQHWLEMLLIDPERCQAFQDQLLQKKLEYWDKRLSVYGDTIDFIGENDDMGTQQGLFVSPTILREEVLSRHKIMIAELKKKYPHIKVVLHSCGAIFDIIPDIIESGIDVLNPIQITAKGMNPERVKKTYGNDIVFWGGGMDTQKLLPYGKPEEIKEAVKRNLDALAPGGGYVFSAVHNIMNDVPIENFMAMWEAFQDNCKY